MSERRFRRMVYFLLVLCGLALADFAALAFLTLTGQGFSSAQARDITPLYAKTTALLSSSAPGMLQLDSRLQTQTYRSDQGADNVNATFGSRFDFTVEPGADKVFSGTDGLYHDNAASYVIGIVPTGEHQTWMFHMGSLDKPQGDAYLLNEKWTQGLDTTRWQGDAGDGSGMHITVDIVDPFAGEPNCLEIYECGEGVRDDTAPVLLIGVTLHNAGLQSLTGKFLFGSNRALPSNNACVEDTTGGGTRINLLSYSASADATGGTLFLAGAQEQWICNLDVKDRAGLAWNYALGPAQSKTAYMVIGGWNPRQSLFTNTQLPAECQQEGLYSATEWSSEKEVADFAIDNLSIDDNLLERAQSMESILIGNSVLTPQQRWVLADSMHNYKADTWLVSRQSCAGGGYDSAVYEGSFRFLTTVDVMYDYGYFEINRVPWFFRSALLTVLAGAQKDTFGVYFQHDQGGDVNSQGRCVDVGDGLPTFRTSCYLGKHPPMPTEEDTNVALLTAYYLFVTGDTTLLTDDNDNGMRLIDAGMQHNQNVADPVTGIAVQDTTTTFDEQNDCLHNTGSQAGNLYYQGLKEAAAYRATAYLDNFIAGDVNSSKWKDNAAKIESDMVQEYNRNGFIPMAENTNAYSNCDGRTVVTGDGLFYLHLIGLDTSMNQTLLHDLARQYPADLAANTLSNPQMITLESTAVAGTLRYEWFSKIMLSSIVADFVYTRYGCSVCHRINVTNTVFTRNAELFGGYCDGIIADGSEWNGYFYPRGMISWAFLNAQY